MKQIKKEIIINAPAHEVYEHWTQFEDLPLIFPGVLLVRQLGDRHFYWQVDLYGREFEWESEVTEQIPGYYVAWRSVVGRKHSGAVSFDKIGTNTTRLSLTLEYETEGAVERLVDFLGALDRHLDRALEVFGTFMEARAHPVENWRSHFPEMETQAAGERWTQY